MRFALLIGVCMIGMTGQAAVLTTASFDLDDENWQVIDLDVGSGHAGGIGNPAGSLIGIMLAPNAMFPTLGGFYADGTASSGDFAGSYTAVGAQSIHFDFRSANIAPSTLSLVLNGPAYSFYYPFTPSPLLNSWVTYSAPLTFSGWQGGGTELQFLATLAGIDSLEIQFDSNGSSSQTYYMDNFTLSDMELAVIPEPGSGSMFFLALIGLLMIRAERRSFRS